MEQKLAAGLRERQIAELVEHNEVQTRQLFCEPALPCAACLDLKPIDEIDNIVEAPARAGADAPSCNGDGKMGLAGAGPADQHDIALFSEETSSSEILDERLVDRQTLELEVIKVFGKRQLGDGHLIFNGPRLLLADLSGEQIGDRAFDYANIFCLPDVAVVTAWGRLQRQAAVVCDAAGIERERLLKWILAYAGLSASWMLADGGDAELPMAVAEIAAAELGL